MTKKERSRISRREFLRYSALAGAAAAAPWRRVFGQTIPVNPAGTGPYGIGSPNLTKFVDPIRGIGTDIPLAGSDGSRVWGSTTAAHYTIDIGEYRDLLHSDFINPAKSAYMGAGYQGTLLRGFGQGGNHKHLGGVIVALRDHPVQITFNNNLPGGFGPIPNDVTVPMPSGNRFDRTSIHIHGGFVPWISDGGPHDWWAPDGSSGDSFLNNIVLNQGAIGTNMAEYYYPNNQPGRLVWYHDHAWGITRTNAYSGIASGYVIADPIGEAAFDAANPGVPSALDLAAINNTFFYLVFQDKIFIPPNTTMPADYSANAGPGDLFYAYIYDPLLFGPAGIPSFGQTLQTPFPVPSCVPEFFGDTILANGTAYPTLEVQARPIRIRMLNACNARFLNPRLVSPSGTTFPSNAEPSPNAWGPRMVQIGTEGGYLPQPVVVAEQGGLPLLMAPAERADVVIDFSKAKPGREFILYNDAPGPFPGGYSGFDYYPGNKMTPTSIPGFGPNTRTLMKFRIIAATGTVTPLPKKLNTAIAGLNDLPLVTQTPGVPTPIPKQVTVNGTTYQVANTRLLTLNEGFDQYGRLAQFIGTDLQAADAVPGFFGREYQELPATEQIGAGNVEVWQIANLTADTHPIHFHLVNVQILFRQAIKTKGFTTAFALNGNGQPVAPDPNELGWKETVRMNPSEVTTVIAKWDLPNVPFTVPPSPRTGGNEYVFHCHILEHEEHDMMRPIVVS